MRYVKHRLFRAAGAHPLDDDVARWIVAGVIAIAAGPLTVPERTGDA